MITDANYGVSECERHNFAVGQTSKFYSLQLYSFAIVCCQFGLAFAAPRHV